MKSVLIINRMIAGVICIALLSCSVKSSTHISNYMPIERDRYDLMLLRSAGMRTPVRVDDAFKDFSRKDVEAAVFPATIGESFTQCHVMNFCGSHMIFAELTVSPVRSDDFAIHSFKGSSGYPDGKNVPMLKSIRFYRFIRQGNFISQGKIETLDREQVRKIVGQSLSSSRRDGS